MKIIVYLFILALYAMTLGSGTYLVITEHYGWAWIPFLIACCISMKASEN